MKTRLAKVRICRQRVRQAGFAHDHEAGAIGKRIGLVVVPEEELACFLEAVAVDTLPSEPGASINLVPPRLRRTHSEPDPEQRECFIDNEIGRHQGLAGLECSVTRRTALRVGRVRGIGTSHPARRVDEERSHRPYKTVSWCAAIRPSRECPTASAR